MKQDRVTSKCFSCFSKEGPEASLGNSHDMSLNFFKCITYYTLKYVGVFLHKNVFCCLPSGKKRNTRNGPYVGLVASHILSPAEVYPWGVALPG